jgi:hypothetical protein
LQEVSCRREKRKIPKACSEEFRADVAALARKGLAKSGKVTSPEVVAFGGSTK